MPVVAIRPSFSARRASGLVAVAGIALLFAGVAAEAGAQSGKSARCRVVSGGEVKLNGPCRFVPDGPNGSFVLENRNRSGRLYGAISLITVAVVEPGVAEVRGLTRDGINSRWGTARRSRRNPACWVGSDFRICAWAQ